MEQSWTKKNKKKCIQMQITINYSLLITFTKSLQEETYNKHKKVKRKRNL